MEIHSAAATVSADSACATGDHGAFHLVYFQPMGGGFMLNRREFLVTGTGAALAAQAATGDRMRFATSGHEFRHTPPHPEEGIKMTARYGYHGLEPFQEDIAKYLDKPPEELKKVLDASGLALATVGSGGQYLDSSKVSQTIENNAARARY